MLIEQEATRSPKERKDRNRRMPNGTYVVWEDGGSNPASYPIERQVAQITPDPLAIIITAIKLDQ